MSEISILHIDDSAEYIEFTRTMLVSTDSNYQIEGAPTIDQARKMLSLFKDGKRKYQVILMDYDLGCSTNGLELVRNYLKDNIGARVIMLSAYEDEFIKNSAKALGVASYLTKKEVMYDCCILHKMILKNLSFSS
jgi:CheY-like chemotaxis protein